MTKEYKDVKNLYELVVWGRECLQNPEIRTVYVIETKDFRDDVTAYYYMYRSAPQFTDRVRCKLDHNKNSEILLAFAKNQRSNQCEDMITAIAKGIGKVAWFGWCPRNDFGKLAHAYKE